LKPDAHVSGTVGGLILALLSSLAVCCVGSALGATWTPEQQVNIDDDHNDWSPEMAVDTTGRAWVVWMEVDPVELDEEVCFRYCEQGTWGPQGTVNPPNTVADRFPELCAGKDDGVPWCLWAGWNSGLGAYDFLVSHWLGDAWSAPETVFVGGGRYDEYDIVATDTTLVWVLWSTRTTEPPTHKDIFARVRVEGVWGDVEQIEIVVGHEGAVRADLDSEGRLWTVWQSDSLDKFVVQSCVRDESGWGEVVHVAADSGGSRLPWVAVDDDDAAWVVWNRGDTGYSGQHIMSARWEAGGWRQLGEVNSVGGEGIGNGNAVIRSVPGSGPLVVWWGGRYQVGDEKDVYESKWTAYGWREQACVSTPDSVYLAEDVYPSSAVGWDGRAWVCWMRCQTSYPYDYDILCRYSDDVTPVYGLSDLGAVVKDAVVVLRWTANYTGRFRVYRSDAVRGDTVSEVKTVPADCGNVGAVLPEGAECLTVEPVVSSGQVEYTDSSVKVGVCYDYWIVEERADECHVHGPVHAELAPAAQRLSQSYPNPFNPVCTIRYEIPQAAAVTLRVFDIGGRLVRTLVNAHREPGTHSELWDGRADDGAELPSGVYFYRLEAGDFAAGRKMVLLK